MFQKIVDKSVNISNTILFLTSTAFFLLAAIVITHLEPENFPNYFVGFWWVMTTVTTTGFGDYVPETVSGRVVGLVLYLFGIGLVGVIIGKILDGLSKVKTDREEGRIVYKGKGHIIIIGWSNKAKSAIEEMLHSRDNIDIVIVDNMAKAPMLSEHVHYVKGNITSGEPLERANIHHAQAILVFSDERIMDRELNDGRTLLVAAAVEAIAPEIHTVVEIMNENHIKNFQHVNVDEFVVSHDTISSLFVRSAFRKGISSVYNQLLRRAHGDDLYYVEKMPEWKTYGDAFYALLKEGATLIADRDNLGINRVLDQPIPEEAELYAICDKKTHEKLKKDLSF